MVAGLLAGLARAPADRVGPVVLVEHQRNAGWLDVQRGSAAYWARGSIQYVGRWHDWMRDFGPRRFRPSKIETKQRLARAVVRALAPSARPSSRIRFRDLPRSDPLFRSANVAVKLGWMSAPRRRFHPESSVTERRLDKVLTVALGLRRAVRGANQFHTTGGYRFRRPTSFGALLIGRQLGLHYNHSAEGRDRAPSAPLPRAEVAWSLRRAATLSRAEIEAHTRGYANMHVGRVSRAMRKVIEFGMRYVGFPYVYAGEWPRRTPAGYCCGAQPRGGFDCSGLMWWVLERRGGSYRVPVRVRRYRGWPLGQRSSSGMAEAIPRRARIPFRSLRAGDLAFYDGDDDGAIDHVDLYLGYGWGLDSSDGGTGGVSIIRVGSSWYRDHFRWGRRMVPR